MAAPKCEKCGKQKGAQAYYQCGKCRRIQCSGCVGGIFSGKCAFCGNKVTKSDKIN